MTVSALLLPVFVQVGLTFFLMFWMGILRRRALSSGAVKPSDIALRQPNWPPRTLQVANCFHNQLELPMLFYVVCIALYVTLGVDAYALALAWLYFALRVGHSLVHLTYNNVYHRLGVYAASGIVLALLWVRFAAALFRGG